MAKEQDGKVLRFPTERVSAPEDRANNPARVASLFSPWGKARKDISDHFFSHTDEERASVGDSSGWDFEDVGPPEDLKFRATCQVCNKTIHIDKARD